jgi:hypothetical protein
MSKMYKDQRGFTDSQDNQKYFNQKYYDKDPGPYVATVKVTNDPLKMGRLGVNIPALSNTTNPKPSQIVWCQYLSPFYGAKSPEATSKTNPYDYKSTQHSYGMWAVPPDIDTEVLVIFAAGNKGESSAFWIGCVQQPLTNQQVPGYGSSSNSSTAALGDYDQTKEQQYGASFLPVGEKNQRLYEDGETLKTTGKWKYPVNDILAEQLLKEGLISDNVRGTTTSSARRESPSQVFGISTPGRIRPDSRQLNIGLEGTVVTPDRSPGHSFVMDDGDAVGLNQLTRLRTASGHQLLMHDTEGVVYIANGSGNAYIEMQSNGRIDIYSGVGGINMRTEGDFNLHSDSNINMHANGQVRFSSAKEMIHSADLLLNLGQKGILNSSQAGSVRDYARDGISSFTSGTQLHGASGQIHLAGSQVHFNSTSASPTWGPNWLTPEKAGIQIRDEGDVELAQKGIKPLEQFTRKTKTTVHRFVTHEPMFRASVIGNDGIIPIDSDDKKRWSQLSRTPGTAEFVNMQNRLSENSAIRDAQYQADALEYVKQKMGSSTDAAKAKQLLTDFGTKYNDIYGITGKVDLPFDIKDSISEKIKGFEFNTDVKDLTSSLTSQVVESFTGKSTELFKDNVFVNQAGELFTLGNNTVSGISGNIDLANNALNSVQGLTKNLSAGNIVPSISNLSSITQTYSSVVGGKIVGMNQVKSLASKAGLFNARDAARGGQTFLQNVGVNLSSKIGAIGGAVKTFFSGFKFSDQRLKEDIKLVGESPSGINIYSFKYKHTDGTYEGVMAQEVPWARTMTHTGFYMVDYGKVDVEFRRLD